MPRAPLRLAVGFRKLVKDAKLELKVFDMELQCRLFAVKAGAKGNGALSQHMNVSGIPAAAVVKDGVVIWRGHPARLDETVLRANAY